MYYAYKHLVIEAGVSRKDLGRIKCKIFRTLGSSSYLDISTLHEIVRILAFKMQENSETEKREYVWNVIRNKRFLAKKIDLLLQGEYSAFLADAASQIPRA